MRHTLTLLCAILINAAASAQEVIVPVTNYTTKNYGIDFHPENQAVIQDHRGIIYAANGFKLLEFDGSEWKSYPINKQTWILSLAVDSNNNIYAGSQGEFGLFEPDGKGNLIYKSISDSLELTAPPFTNIWKVNIFSRGVVFQAEEAIFIYNNGKIETILPLTSFHTSFVVNDQLYVRQRGSGLMVLKGNTLEKVTGSEIFSNTGIFMMVDAGNNQIITGTRGDGLWMIDLSGTNPLYSRLTGEAGSVLDKALITCATETSNGEFAIGTASNGIFILNGEGKIIQTINTGNGLNNNEIKSLVTDRSSNIWAATSNGISMAEVSSPLSFYSDQNGVTGSTNTVIRFNGKLYAGTGTGLRFNSDGAHFETVEGINSPVRSLASAGNRLFAGTDAGLYEIHDSKARLADTTGSWVLMFSGGLNVLFSGGQKGLKAWSAASSLIELKNLKVPGEDIIGICEDLTDPSGSAFWLGTRYSGILRIVIKDHQIVLAERYTSNDGLPQGPVIPSVFSKEVLFSSSDGLYSFINKESVRRTLPDSLKNNEMLLKGYFTPAGISDRTGSGSVSLLTEGTGKLWLSVNNKTGWINTFDTLAINTIPFEGIEAGKINSIYPENDSICWIGSTEGLIRYDAGKSKDYKTVFHVLLRKVSSTGNDSSLYNNVSLPSALKYRYNAIRFDFASPFFEYPEKITYSYLLEKTDNEWSNWSSSRYKEYTNLHEGEYTFRVKARNVYGTESTSASFSFIILPPWYRTTIAYILYAILTLILFWVSLRLYTYRLKSENIRLEGIVSERTAEIASKNTVLEHQKKEIEDSIRYAGRIQNAVIPSENAIREILPESFIFFRPLNIVSGDFYWIGRVGSKIVFTAADCTGHGVPGAFMSMLGVAFLNEIVNKDNISSPDLILNNLRIKVIQALQQQGISGETRDGMDIAIVSFDTQTYMIEYAGAYNPLIMIRSGAISEFPGDKMPIGFHDKVNPFKRHEIKVEKGDFIYMYSDGYEDQFGGPDEKKFKSKKLKALFTEISNLPAQEQKNILASTFDEWKGAVPQIDDVVIAGFRVI